MFTLTQAAAEQIRNAAAAQQADEDLPPYLRVAAKLEEGEIVYGMGFDDEREHDAMIESNGITLLIAPRSQELLHGATLDFVELRPGEFQFVFINPNDPGMAGACASRQPNSGGCGSCGSANNAGGCGR